MTCCACARFEEIEGSANAGTAAKRAMQIPARTYGARPCLRMTTPMPGAGRTHREGPVRHEWRRLAGLSDERQPQTCPKHAQNVMNSALKATSLLGTYGTVRL